MGKLGDSLGRAVVSPLKALIPKNPWIRLLLIAIPILVVLALLEPVLSLFEKGIDMFTRLLTPLLETPGGRLLLLNVLLLLVCVVGFFLLRARLRHFRSGLVLRRHLDAVHAMASDQPRRARENLRRVARSRSAPPTEFPAVVEDAKLKLARLSLDEGDVDGAIRYVTKVRARELPKELERTYAQLRGMTFLAQGEIEPETLQKELSAAASRFGNDVRILDMLREIAIQRGQPVEAAALQERIAKHELPRRLHDARQRLLEDYIRAGEAELAAERPDAARAYARKAAKLEPEAHEPGVLLGRVLLAKGDVRGAVREWGKTRSPAGLDQIARLLDERPGAVSPREILESCPVRGAVLLVAREYARRGDTVRAERAARNAARELGMSPSVAAVLSEVLERCGRSDEARQITEQAVRHLLADDSASTT